MKLTRFIIPIGVFALLVVVLAIGIKRSPEKGIIASPLIGKPAPTFELPSLTDANRTVGSGDLRGRWYVLNVWGTWCVECRYEHSTLLDVQRTAGVPIVGLNYRDNDGDALRWLTQLGNPYEFVAADREGRVAIDWGVYGAPETFLVNPEGVVVEKHVGPLTREIWDREFQSHLPRTPPEKS